MKSLEICLKSAERGHTSTSVGVSAVTFDGSHPAAVIAALKFLFSFLASRVSLSLLSTNAAVVVYAQQQPAKDRTCNCGYTTLPCSWFDKMKIYRSASLCTNQQRDNPGAPCCVNDATYINDNSSLICNVNCHYWRSSG